MMLVAVSDARRGWAMWALPALLFLIAFFHRSAPGIIAKDLMHDFNTTAAIVGLLSATYFYAYAGLMIPAGLCIDAFGVRRVVSAGGLVMGFGTVAMGLAATPWALFAARFAVGLGAATTFIGALKVAATWFPPGRFRSEEHTSELQSRFDLVCRLLLEKKNTKQNHASAAHSVGPPILPIPALPAVNALRLYAETL